VGAFVDHTKDRVSYNSFFNKEFIYFSIADNVRSIPSLMDGLKPGQRKVLFACFKRNLRSEIKVAQLAGYVSEHTGYHHGEASLHGTIVKMAQQFVGSNNIALLTPSGQFGTRLTGGHDAASARYIFTKLEEITRLVFREADDAILEYLNDDGYPIEPKFYAPIIPMILVNGCEGMGTGWSTKIPTFHPVEIIDRLIAMLDAPEQPRTALVPWTRGFKGSFVPSDDGTFATRGVVTQQAVSFSFLVFA
jgi:DNA topoisomerase-2